MTARPLLGLALQPDTAFWRHAGALAEQQAELFEVTPETLWREGCEPGPGRAEMLAFVRRCGRPVVGHGVLFSLGAATPPARREPWLRALQREQEAFGFAWFSEHLGVADAGGMHVAWPMPLPPTAASVAVVAGALRALQRVHPVVAFENNADFVALGDPLAQPEFFGAICAAADAHLLLDLHNAYATCRNLGVPLDAWLDRVPWDRVLQIHLSGGSESDPEFLPNRRSLRLDSHDGAVPEPVWRAFERSLPRATGLRAVVLEWLPEAMDERAGAQLGADYARARSMLC